MKENEHMGGVIIEGRRFIDGTAGGRRLMWKEFAVITRNFIRTEKLKPVKLSVLADKKPIRWPRPLGGIPVPHLHYGGKLYILPEVKWRKFSNRIVRDLKIRMGNIKNVDMDRLSAMSAVVNVKQR
jgi:hypothetical protein